MAKKRCGEPMPAQATTRRPLSQPASSLGTVEARSTGPLKCVRSQSAMRSPAPGTGSLTTTASVSSSWKSSGARSGPAGITMPLPMPRTPSTRAMLRSLARRGFCRPSSMTMTVAGCGPVSMARAPCWRSRASWVGTTRASSSASSPTSRALSVPALTQ